MLNLVGYPLQKNVLKIQPHLYTMTTFDYETLLTKKRFSIVFPRALLDFGQNENYSTISVSVSTLLIRPI